MNINTITPANGSSGAVEAPTPSAPVKTDVSQLPQAEQRTRDQGESVLSAEAVKELAETMNDAMDSLQTRIGFSIREDLNHQVVVEIKNRDTDELVKQIPSEELLAIKEKMEEFTGLLFDQKA